MVNNKKLKYNIIGISGRIKSGKDTIGAAIRYLSSEQHAVLDMLSFGDFLKEEEITGALLNGNTPYNIKKFADKLKDIVCLLIGCTRIQLEDHEFKNSPLGDKWKVYRALERNKVVPGAGYKMVVYANKSDVPKDAVSVEEEILTPRRLLQLIGTDCGRLIIHPHLWINATFADWKPYPKEKSGHVSSEEMMNDMSGVYRCMCQKSGEYFYSKNKHQTLCLEEWEKQSDRYPYWLITDVRYPNEAKAIQEMGGVVIKVERHWDERFPDYKGMCDGGDVYGVPTLLQDKNPELYKSLVFDSETSTMAVEPDFNLINTSLDKLVTDIENIIFE